MNASIPSYKGVADSICAAIKKKRDAVDGVLREAIQFIDELPDGERKAQLRAKLDALLSTDEQE